MVKVKKKMCEGVSTVLGTHSMRRKLAARVIGAGSVLSTEADVAYTTGRGR